MTKPTQEFIEEVAKKNRFLGATVEHVYWMKNILKAMQKTPLSHDFALMGGSAIAFLYENIYRLSIDLDLDYIANPDLGREGSYEIEELQNKHFKFIQDIGDQLNLKVNQIELTKDRRFAQFQLTYPSVYGGTKSVDLDLGYRYCHSILEPNIIDFPDFIDKDKIKVRTLAPEEIWASKIIAAIGGNRMDVPEDNRGGKVFLGFKRKIRHLYDCYHLVKNIFEKQPNKIDFEILKKLVVLMGVTRIEEFEFFRGDMISLYSEKEIDEQLRPVIKTTKDPPDLLTMKRTFRKFLDQHVFAGYDENIYEFFEDFSANIFRPQRLFEKNIANVLKKMFYYDEILDKVIKKKEAL